MSPKPKNAYHRNRPVRGLWIVLLGPDGVGKSAVIQQLGLELESAFAHVTRFHFRPHFRHRDLCRPPVTNPHGQAPRGVVISIAKLFYWLLDCWFGYIVTVQPMRRRDALILFDRYYPDTLVDPVRYRLPSRALKFARLFARLAPQPDLYVLLDAAADVVQQRKRELAAYESQRQRFAYLNLLSRMPNALIVNAEANLEDVTQRLTSAILSFQGDARQSRQRSLVANY